MDFVTKLDDFFLDIINITDNFSFSIATHEYPFSSKNKLEHIGEKTRKIRVKCVFTQFPTESTGWELGLSQPTYENHYDFLDYIKEYTSFTFVHPKYGQLTGAIPVVNVTQDDTINYAAIDFDFLVQDTKQPNYEKPIEALQAKGYAASSTKTLSNINAAAKLSNNLVSWTGKTQTVINKINAYANAVTSPATSIANTIYYASDVPSQLLESMNFAIDRALQPIIAGYTSPSASLRSMVLAARSLVASISNSFPDTDVEDELTYFKVVIASRVSYESAVIYEADNTAGKEQKEQEDTRVFDENGNFVTGVAYTEVMTINELDDTCYDIKALLDEAIQADREQPALKTQGATLQKYINQIKLNRERIITKDEVPETSMHQIANDYDLPYGRAEQLLKLNPQIKNPTFSSGSIKILTRET